MAKVTQKLYKIGYDNINIELDLMAKVLYETPDLFSEILNSHALENVRVCISHPNASGVEVLKDATNIEQDLRPLCFYVHSGDVTILDIYLRGLCAGTHNVYVAARFGTQTRVIYRGVVVVANNPSSDWNQDIKQEEITVCETYGVVDGNVYQVDGDSASITETLKVNGNISATGTLEGNGLRLGNEQVELNDTHCIAFGAVNTDHSDNQIAANKNGSMAFGSVNSDDGFRIVANAQGALAFGMAYQGNIEADGVGSIAAGYGACYALGEGSVAIGQGVVAKTSHSVALGNGTVASDACQVAIGKLNVEDTNDDYAFIIGNGTSYDNRSNAFAIDWQGNLVLFNNGTPVVLTPAKLAALIA